jgi:hypothetical protein
MVAGQWYNPDGLLVNYGTQKAFPELGGSYLAYGETRVVEVYISLAQTTFGNPTGGSNVQVPALPSSFAGGFGSAAQSAGILSLNTFLPLQTIAPIVTATAGLGLLLNQEQIWMDRVEFLTLIPANTGNATTATGLQGIGLVGQVGQGQTVATSSAPVFVQITPNSTTQILGAVSTATMSNQSKFTFWPSGSTGSATNMTAWPTGSSASLSSPTAGVWGGNFPLITNTQTNPSWASPQNPSGLIPWGYLASWASTGQYTGSTAAGLCKVRVFWNKYGVINQ